MNSSQLEYSSSRDEIDVIGFLQMLWRYKITILLITTSFVLASVYYALTATSLYRAEVVVTEVNDDNMSGISSFASRLGGLATLAGAGLAGSSSGREKQAILESRQLVEEFIKRNNLLIELFPSKGQQATIWLAVQKFRDNVLSIEEVESEGTTTIAILWTDPEVASRWANNFVSLANENIRTRAIENSAANIAYLKKQIERTNVVEIQNVMYNLIESETKTSMLANGRHEYAFTVVDPAVAPEVRSSPKRKLIVMTGSALGLLLSVLIILVWTFIQRLKLSEPAQK